MVDDLVAMHKAATAAGATFDVVSAHRSQEYQERVLERERQVLGPDTTDSVALPGHSEHQLGTTVGVVDPSLLALSPALADLPAGRWLASHAHEHGFMISYPRGEQAASCYEYEPWYLRYVGRDLAAAVEESDL